MRAPHAAGMNRGAGSEAPLPNAGATLLARARQAWPLRTLAAGAASVALDYTTLIVLVQFAHFVPVTASVIGVIAGGALDFVLNKYVAFRNHDQRIGRQAAIFAAFTGGALVVYTTCFYFLTTHFRVPYVIAKIGVDILVFGLGGFLTNRFLVFPAK